MKTYEQAKGCKDSTVNPKEAQRTGQPNTKWHFNKLNNLFLSINNLWFTIQLGESNRGQKDRGTVTRGFPAMYVIDCEQKKEKNKFQQWRVFRLAKGRPHLYHL